MSRVWYVFFIILIAFVALFLIFLMFVDHTRSHLIASDLSQANVANLEASRDDSSRMAKGVYGINTGIYINNFAHHTTIKSLNTSKNNQDNYYFVIRFQQDNNNTDAENNSITKDYFDQMGDGDTKPIRDVQVIAVPKKDVSGNNQAQQLASIEKELSNQNSKSSKSKYVSSVALQEFDLDANKDFNDTDTIDSSNINQKLYGQGNNKSLTHTENNSSKTNSDGNNISNNNDATDLSDNN